MPSHKVRVIPKFPRQGLHYLCIGAGLALGLGGSWIMVFTREFVRFGTMSSGSMFTAMLLAGAIFVLPAMAFAMLINRVHPHLGRTLVCAVIFGPSAFAGICAVYIARYPDWILPDSYHPDVMDRLFLVAVMFTMGGGMVCVIVVCATCAVFALGYAIEHTLGRRVIFQTGSICWVCGYDLGVRGPGTCPECGRAFHPDDRYRAASPGILARLVKVRWIAIGLFLVLSLTPIVYDLATYSLPALRFLRARPPGVGLKNTAMSGTWFVRNATLGRNWARPISGGWWLPDTTDPTTGMLVQYNPSSRIDEPKIVIIRAYLNGPPGQSDLDLMRFPESGSVRVLSRLSSAQAEHIIRSRAVPRGLIDAIHDRAAAVSWQPAGPAAGAGAQEHLVDPEPYFPQ